jgi:hypothetical protein
MPTIEFLSDAEIEQLAWLRDVLFPLPPTPSNDEERKDYIKRLMMRIDSTGSTMRT